MQNRRLVLAGLGLAAAPALTARAQTPTAQSAQGPARKPVTTDDMVMGSANAPVTLIEYASVGCPHCARFNNEVFPALKRKYIDTGQVKYVAREMLTGSVNLAGLGFLTARCAGADKYFQVVDAIYRGQEQWVASGNIADGLISTAKAAGLSEAEFNACIRDNAAIDALNARVTRNREMDDVDSTPTFVINGVKAPPGEKTLEEMDALIAAAKAAVKPAR